LRGNHVLQNIDNKAVMLYLFVLDGFLDRTQQLIF
jgi:hypothetical protein